MTVRLRSRRELAPPSLNFDAQTHTEIKGRHQSRYLHVLLTVTKSLGWPLAHPYQAEPDMSASAQSLFDRQR